MLSDHISTYTEPHTFFEVNLCYLCKEIEACHVGSDKKTSGFEKQVRGCGIAVGVDVDIHLPLTFTH